MGPMLQKDVLKYGTGGGGTLSVMIIGVCKMPKLHVSNWGTYEQSQLIVKHILVKDQETYYWITCSVLEGKHLSWTAPTMGCMFITVNIRKMQV